MKKPCHGIKSMQTKTTLPLAVSVSPITTTLPAPSLPGAPYAFSPAAVQSHPILHQANLGALPHRILDDVDASIVNVFCFGAFADNAYTGVVYSDLTGNFPFMSSNKSIYFLVMCHYESNAIQPTQISGLDNLCIFNAYKKRFNKLISKGFKPKQNVMDNQATTFHLKKSHQRGKLTAALGAAQPLCECCQTRHPDIQRCLHHCLSYH